MQKGAGKNKEARAAYEKALSHASGTDMKKKVLRALADLALTTGDNEGANDYFKQFLDLDPKNAQLWIERGDAMLAAGKRDVALESYTAAEKLLGSDPAKHVEIVSRRGQALEAMGKDDEAVAEYRRAIKLAPKGYYLEVELTGRIIDIYRRKQALPQLLAQYDKEWPEGARGHFEWNTLGRLYEETGAQDKAIAALKKAVAKAPYELETQRRLIQLLENSGRDDEALRAVRGGRSRCARRGALSARACRALLAPRRREEGTRYARAAADAVSQRRWRAVGDRRPLHALGQGRPRDHQYERLAKLEPDDPAHLVTLGEQYYQKGDKKRANDVWKRLTATGKAPGYAKLRRGQRGAQPANRRRDELQEGDRPRRQEPRVPQGPASLYESTKRYQEAMTRVEEGPRPHRHPERIDSRAAMRRGTTVQIVTRMNGNVERDQLKKWKDGFDKPADSEAGYFLVEYYTRKNDYPSCAATLEKQRTLVPDDYDLLLDLVKAYRHAPRPTRPSRYSSSSRRSSPRASREIYQQISESRPRRARTTRRSSGHRRPSRSRRRTLRRTSSSPSATSRCNASPRRLLRTSRR